MNGIARAHRIARNLGALVIALSVLAPSAARAADVACPAADPSGMAANYLAEVFDLTFCWQPLGSGLTYRIETSTNRGSWVQEATVTDNHVSLLQDLGNRLQVRLSVCQGSLCSPPSEASKLTYIWPNYDANGSGVVTIADFWLLKSQLSTPREMRRFQTVFGFHLVNGRYLRKLPS